MLYIYCLVVLLFIIGGRMVCMLASSAVDRVFEARSGQSKDYKFVSSPLSMQH